MFRFILYAVPLLLVLLALFGFTVELFEFDSPGAQTIRLGVLDSPRIPARIVFGTWLLETMALLALFLLLEGRCGAWWLDGLVTGWIAWIFRGPILVITIVVAARQQQDPWWTLAFAWWILYTVCGLALAMLARRSRRGDKSELAHAYERSTPQAHDAWLDNVPALSEDDTDRR